MSKEKERFSIGTDGLPLPILPPDRDVRVWAKLVRVMFYTPGFMALLLLKTGEPAGFGITVELLMLSSAAAVVAGLFVGTQAIGGGADVSSKVGVASCSLIMELLSAIPFLCAVPPLCATIMARNACRPVVPVTVAPKYTGQSSMADASARLSMMAATLTPAAIRSRAVRRASSLLAKIVTRLPAATPYLCR